jgi:hypothetical protein
VGAVVIPHVDELGGTLHSPESRLADRLGRADEGDDRAVRVGTRVDVQQRDAGHGLDGVGDLPDERLVTPFGKVRHALDDPFHLSVPLASTSPGPAAAIEPGGHGRHHAPDTRL